MQVLDLLMNRPEAELSKAENSYLETVALLIQAYEKTRVRLPEASPAEALAEMISQHGLKQRDLLDVFGTETAVSYAVHGKRGLTTEQIRALAEKFHVSPVVLL